MKTEIFYYSGTGNSLAVAKELQARLPGSRLIPLVALLASDRILADAELVGLVFPVYAFGLPAPVREFLDRLELGPARSAFALATRGGSPCAVFSEIDSILRKKGRSLGSRAFIDMPSNAVGMHELDPPEETARKERAMKSDVEAFATALLEDRQFRRRDPHGNFLKERLLFPVIGTLARATDYMGAARSFYAEPSCTGCGICSDVCLSRRIEMVGGRPRWRSEPACHFCLACLNYCPSRSVQVGALKTASAGRYHHAAVGYREIAGQKRS
jgi:ferredoxin